MINPLKIVQESMKEIIQTEEVKVKILKEPVSLILRVKEFIKITTRIVQELAKIRRTIVQEPTKIRRIIVSKTKIKIAQESAKMIMRITQEIQAEIVQELTKTTITTEEVKATIMKALINHILRVKEFLKIMTITVKESVKMMMIMM